MNSHRLEFSQEFCFHTPPPALHRSSSDCPAHAVSPKAATSRAIPTFRMWLTGIPPLEAVSKSAKMTWVDREQTRGYGRCPHEDLGCVACGRSCCPARRGHPGPRPGRCAARSLGPLAGGLRVSREGMRGVGQPGRVHTGASLQVGRESSRTPRKGAGEALKVCRAHVLQGVTGEALGPHGPLPQSMLASCWASTTGWRNAGSRTAVPRRSRVVIPPGRPGRHGVGAWP
jgi:hypothetical protein